MISQNAEKELDINKIIQFERYIIEKNSFVSREDSLAVVLMLILKDAEKHLPVRV